MITQSYGRFSEDFVTIDAVNKIIYTKSVFDGVLSANKNVKLVWNEDTSKFDASLIEYR